MVRNVRRYLSGVAGGLVVVVLWVVLLWLRVPATGSAVMGSVVLIS